MKLHLPYFSGKTKITVQNEVVEVKAYQIIVWVSVTYEESTRWDSRTPRIPAILDIGNNHNFAVSQSQLVKWAGIHPASLPAIKNVRESGQTGILRTAGLWLHMDTAPISLSIPGGIVIMPGAWPRLPILGLRALTNSKLQTLIYGDTMQVLIRTPPKWHWPL